MNEPTSGKKNEVVLFSGFSGRKFSLRSIFFVLFTCWTVLVIALAFWDYFRTNNFILETVQHLAWDSLSRDFAFRRWAAIHEGAHVPLAPQTPSNTHREQLPSKNAYSSPGEKPAMSNPPSIFRHALDMINSGNVLRSHITTQKPIISENTPDEWEKKALAGFENGINEKTGIDKIGNQTYFRFMVPLTTEPKCQSCHDINGDKSGELVAGVSLSIPLKHLENLFFSEFQSQIITYGILLMTGIFVLWFGRHSLGRYLFQQEHDKIALESALLEKEVLLKEVHHRVKNNLAVIIGLLDIQMQNMADELKERSLSELSSRIRSMAMVHEQIYQSRNISRINFQDYLETLIDPLCSSYDRTGYIHCSVAAPGVEMDLDSAVPCGMYITELVTNALKYAFPSTSFQLGDGCCEISVSVQWDGTLYTVTVADNGVGLPADLDWINTDSMGLNLVKMFGEHQLQGQIEVDQARGTAFRLRFAPRKMNTN
jgi:two-component sensor histidine kinase